MAVVSIVIPYDPTLGKNAGHEFGGSKMVRKKKATTSNQNAITIQLQIQCKPRGVETVKFRKDKLTVWMHITRPIDPRIEGPRKDTDPANFQPFIVDAVEKGIGVDDSFYETRVTWSVAKPKEKPSIAITVTQEEIV